jgi:hypothetical protein
MRKSRTSGVRAILCTGLTLGLTHLAPAAEQAVSAAAFAQNPAQYLNRRIMVGDFACYSDGSAYRCASGIGLDLVSPLMAPGAAKKKIDGECGAFDGIERTPGCVFDLVFTPTSVAKGEGDIVRNGVATTGVIWIIQATNVIASTHR